MPYFDLRIMPYFKSLLFFQDQFLPRPSTINLVESEDSQATALQLKSDAYSDNEVEETSTSQANETVTDDSLMFVPTLSSSSTLNRKQFCITGFKSVKFLQILLWISKYRIQLLKEKRV